MLVQDVWLGLYMQSLFPSCGIRTLFWFWVWRRALGSHAATRGETWEASATGKKE